MTDKEVMQMALETAEQIACADYRHWEELASLGEFERWARSRANHIAEALRAALAQPEPEPVAWRFDYAKYRENDLRGRQWAFNVFSQTKPYMDEMVQDVTPLYTAPPQREWQGLTDEEIIRLRHLYDPTAHWSLDMFARVIEAKLKEKNT